MCTVIIVSACLSVRPTFPLSLSLSLSLSFLSEHNPVVLPYISISLMQILSQQIQLNSLRQGMTAQAHLHVHHTADELWSKREFEHALCFHLLV